MMPEKTKLPFPFYKGLKNDYCIGFQFLKAKLSFAYVFFVFCFPSWMHVNTGWCLKNVYALGNS